MLSNKSFNFNDLNIKVDLIVKLLLFLIGIFVFFDINIFLFSFEYSLGNFIEILSTIDIFNVSFVLLVLAVPFSFIIILLLVFILIEKFYNYLLTLEKLVKLIKALSFQYIIILICIPFIFSYIVTKVLWAYMNSFDNIYMNVIFLLFEVIIVIGITKFIINIKKEEYKNKEYSFCYSLDWIILISFFTYSIIVFNFDFPIVIKLVNLTLLFFMGAVFTPREFSEKKSKNIPFLVIFIFIFILALIIQILNQDTWKKPINTGEQKISSLTFNLIFNKPFLVENKSAVKLEIPYKYFKNEIDELLKEKLINLNVKLKEKDLLLYEINHDFYYLKASSTINMYFINLVKIDEEYFLRKNFVKTKNSKEEFVGYLSFLVEKKSFSNKKGAEYILMDMKIIEF